MSQKRWDRVEQLLRELEIPTEIKAFVMSFGKELTQGELNAFSI